MVGTKGGGERILLSSKSVCSVSVVIDYDFYVKLTDCMAMEYG